MSGGKKGDDKIWFSCVSYSCGRNVGTKYKENHGNTGKKLFKAALFLEEQSTDSSGTT